MRDHGQRVHQSSPPPFLYQTAESRPMHDYTELGSAGRFKEAEIVAKRLQLCGTFTRLGCAGAGWKTVSFLSPT
jgi:hypothetical protein